jgi:hypothetical protein
VAETIHDFSMSNISLPATRLALQGDKVMVTTDGETAVLTIVHVIDGEKRELMLADRVNKGGEHFPLTQEMADMLKPFKDPKDPVVKWQLTI